MKDLSNIPDRFHILFTSDWNKGNESKMTSVERGRMVELYLEYNRWSIQELLKSKQPKETQQNQVGFID